MANIASNMSLGVANVANNMSKMETIYSVYLASSSEKLGSNLSQASWAFVQLGHSPPEEEVY